MDRNVSDIIRKISVLEAEFEAELAKMREALRLYI